MTLWKILGNFEKVDGKVAGPRTLQTTVEENQIVKNDKLCVFPKKVKKRFGYTFDKWVICDDFFSVPFGYVEWFLFILQKSFHMTKGNFYLFTEIAVEWYYYTLLPPICHQCCSTISIGKNLLDT